MVIAAESTSLGLALVLGLVMLASAAAVWITAERAANGSLGPNRWAGIRTGATMESPEAWQEAHRVSRSWSRASAVIGVITGVLVLFFRSPPVATLVILMVGIALVLVTTVIGGVRGIAAARELNAASG